MVADRKRTVITVAHGGLRAGFDRARRGQSQTGLMAEDVGALWPREHDLPGNERKTASGAARAADEKNTRRPGGTLRRNPVRDDHRRQSSGTTCPTAWDSALVKAREIDAPKG